MQFAFAAARFHVQLHAERTPFKVGMFERYTEAARRTLFFARYEATQHGSVTIEPEHLLLGLLRETGGRTAQWLRSSRDRIREDLTKHMSTSAPVTSSVEVPFTHAAKRILENAAVAADSLRHSYIGTEHLLLALLGEEQTQASAVLGRFGFRHADVRTLAAAVTTEESSEAHNAPAVIASAAGTETRPARPTLTAREYLRTFIETLDAFDRVIDLDPDGRALVARIRRDIETLNSRFTKPEEE